MNWSKGILVGIVGIVVYSAILIIGTWLISRPKKPSPDLSVRHTTPVTVRVDTAWVDRWQVTRVPEIPDSVLQRIDLMQPLLLYYRHKSDSLAQELAQTQAPKTLTSYDSTDTGFRKHSVVILLPAGEAQWNHWDALPMRPDGLLAGVLPALRPAGGFFRRFGVGLILIPKSDLYGFAEFKVKNRFDLIAPAYGFTKGRMGIGFAWHPF